LFSLLVLIITKEILEQWLRISKRLDFMRHTFALLSLQQGVDIKTLQSDLGHESIETTLDRYGHVNEEMKRSASDKRSELLKTAFKKERSRDINLDL
jgi:integrase